MAIAEKKKVTKTATGMETITPPKNVGGSSASTTADKKDPKEAPSNTKKTAPNSTSANGDAVGSVKGVSVWKRPGYADLPAGRTFSDKFNNSEFARRLSNNGFDRGRVTALSENMLGNRLDILASAGVKVNAATAQVMANKAWSDAKSVDYQMRMEQDRQRRDGYFQALREKNMAARDARIARQNALNAERAGKNTPSATGSKEPPQIKNSEILATKEAAEILESKRAADNTVENIVREAVGAPKLSPGQTPEVKLTPNTPDGQGIPVIPTAPGKESVGLGVGLTGMYLSGKMPFPSQNQGQNQDQSQPKSSFDPGYKVPTVGMPGIFADMKGGYSSLGSDGKYHRFSLLTHADAKGGTSAPHSAGPRVVATRKVLKRDPKGDTGIEVNGKAWKPTGPRGRVMTDGSIVFGDVDAASDVLSGRRATRKQLDQYRADHPRPPEDTPALLDLVDYALGKETTGAWKRDPGAAQMEAASRDVDSYTRVRRELESTSARHQRREFMKKLSDEAGVDSASQASGSDVSSTRDPYVLA